MQYTVLSSIPILGDHVAIFILNCIIYNQAELKCSKLNKEMFYKVQTREHYSYGMVEIVKVLEKL